MYPEPRFGSWLNAARVVSFTRLVGHGSGELNMVSPESPTGHLQRRAETASPPRHEVPTDAGSSEEEPENWRAPHPCS